MLLALVLCVFSVISPAFCVRRRYSGTNTKEPSIPRSNSRITTRDDFENFNVTNAYKSYTIPPAYRSECESIKPCLDRIMKVIKHYADIIKRFDGENKILQFQDYSDYDFLNDDISKPCESLPYDNETLIALLNLCSGKVEGAVPSNGEVWPRPLYQKKYHNINEIDIQNLTMKAIGNKCSIIDRALDRSVEYINALTNLTKNSTNAGAARERKSLLTTVVVNLREPVACEGLYPQFGMDESYNLSVSLGKATIISASVWGALRGIETFNHLMWLPADLEYIAINDTIIEDRPKYPHRGLFVDTAWHSISETNIMSILDGMAMNKMNVLHWHMVDNQSFPIDSESLVELTLSGFEPSSEMYNKTFMESVVEYARDRGIRVIVEIDIVGHLYSLRFSYPEIMSNCPSINSSFLNPLSEKTYAVLQDLIEEVQSVFPEHFLHFGGDDLYTGCWRENNETRKYMDEHGIDENVLLEMFLQRVMAFAKNDSRPILWEDLFTSHSDSSCSNSSHNNLSKSTVIQTWRENGPEIVCILNAGYSVIQSNNYGLDNLGNNFNNFYSTDPRMQAKSRVKNSTLLTKLLGSEAYLWGERLKSSYMLSRLWPRTSALAEVLWSETNGHNPDAYTLSRVEEQACRMRRRGVAAVSASHCHLNNTNV